MIYCMAKWILVVSRKSKLCLFNLLRIYCTIEDDQALALRVEALALALAMLALLTRLTNSRSESSCSHDAI
jgi:hypothetical protein